MNAVTFESVSKIFRHRPALFNWVGRERTGETRALNQISVRVPAGEVLVLLGPNGSGKTTILKLVSTLLLPDKGHVFVEGADTRTQGGQVRKHVGFAMAGERSFFPRLSARENLHFFAALENIPRKDRAERVDQLLEETGLLPVANTLVMKFSSGMYQRLGIARALVKRPSILLLDEPTRSLDPASAADFWDLVRALASPTCTVLLASHSFHEAAAVSEEVVVLSQGRLVAQQKLSTRTSADELRAFYFASTAGLEEVSDVPVGMAG
jgi:ABC-2 type transport system ATP-binding protein